MVELTERFWSKVDKQSSECWLWRGPLIAGYGVFGVGPRPTRKTYRAHRLTYEALVGPIPPGLHVDHLCRNRACVNPAHLEPVTMHENIARGQVGEHQRIKTHCPRGHEYTSENTARVNASGRKPFRRCRTCKAKQRKEN